MELKVYEVIKQQAHNQFSTKRNEIIKSKLDNTYGNEFKEILENCMSR